ncbi:MAG: ABC transporter permease [Magnetococcales bacterium]|nr:ABC transporter permease [Magnetococcales bacterium]
MYLLKLTVLEWSRSFRFNNKGGGGQRDFMWLSLMICLLLTLALLVWSSREGVLNRFVDISLGYVQGAGVPIWVAANILDGTAIDNKMLSKIQQLGKKKFSGGLTIYPYREVEPRDVSLPGWSAEKTYSNKENAPVVWAVQANDPLWREKNVANQNISDHEASNSYLQVLLNRPVFAKQFRCDQYRKALEAELTQVLLDQEPVKFTEPLACLSNGWIWLSVNLGGFREMHRFSILWNNTPIISLERVVMLIPLSTYHAIKLTANNPDISFPTTAPGNDLFRIKKLILRKKPEKNDKSTMSGFTKCMTTGSWEGDTLHFPIPQLQSRIAGCAHANAINLVTHTKKDKTYAGLTFYGNAKRLSPPQPESDSIFKVHCASLNDAFYPMSECWKKTDWAKLDVVQALGGYFRALAYVENRTNILQAVDLLSKLTTAQLQEQHDAGTQTALYIHPAYFDAMVRFDFINQIIDGFQSPYGTIFGIFLFVVLWSQIGLILHNRRRDYGVLLANGFRFKDIHFLLFSQLFLCVLVAWLGALCSIGIVHTILLFIARDLVVSGNFLEYLPISELNLLPIDIKVLIYSLVIGWMATWTVAETLWQIIMLGGSRNGPAQLLNE